MATRTTLATALGLMVTECGTVMGVIAWLLLVAFKFYRGTETAPRMDHMSVLLGPMRTAKRVVPFEDLEAIPGRHGFEFGI